MKEEENDDVTNDLIFTKSIQDILEEMHRSTSSLLQSTRTKSISNDNASEVVNETVGLLNTKALEQIRIKLNGFGIEVLLKEVDEWDEYDKIETLLNIKENVVE